MKLFIYYLIISVSLLSCKKDDDLPPEEQIQPPITAENTFSCNINGELFIPEDFSSFPNNFDGYQISFFEPINSFTSQFQNSEKKLDIHIDDLFNTGDFILGNADGDSDFLYDENTVIEYSLNRGDPTHISTEISGTIEVLELEFGNKIIFQFDEIVLRGIDDPDDIITLTDGKANFNLSTFEN